jgi:hypothetical protein
MLQRHQLRAYDALHLVYAPAIREAITCQQLSGPVFMAADDALLAVAAAKGSTVDNPLQYPRENRERLESLRIDASILG